MRVLLVSTYELGHQPVHVAAPAAALLDAGHEVRAVDLAVEPWQPDALAWADAVAFSVPMHTAMRLALQAAEHVRRMRPEVPICLYGLYAAVAQDQIVGTLVDRAIAGEYTSELVAWVESGASAVPQPVTVTFAREAHRVPRRDVVPMAPGYAHLALDGELRLAAAVNASNGCAHSCRHCPVPAVYHGRVRPVPVDVVLDDVAQLVAAGVQHVSFADPDFLSAPAHGRRVVDAVHGAFPALTFDITTKVEHIVHGHADWSYMSAAGCLFVVSAFECVNNEILAILDKGHTAADAARAVALLREHGIEIRPSFLPFMPWTTVEDVLDICEFVATHDLAGNVDPVQFAIKLLLPDGSLLLDQPALAPYLGPYDAQHLTWTWRAADPRTVALQQELAALVERKASCDIVETFSEVYAVVRAAAGRSDADALAVRARTCPRLTESWFCCAEPTDAQLAPLNDLGR